MADSSANKPGNRGTQSGKSSSSKGSGARPARPTGARPAAAKPSGAKAAGARTSAPKAATSRGAAAAGGARATRPRPRRTRGGLARRIAGVLAVIVLALALLASLATMVFYNRTELPDPNTAFTTNTPFLYYNDSKTKLGSFAVQNRQSLPYDQMPATIKDAVVAAENRTFWTDRGISPSGIVRSAWTIARGGEMQGGSTITQQYIKILYLSSDRTMTRKLRELALAVKMGKQQPKEEILQGYLNTIYFGRGAYGIQAASRSYFNVDAKQLTVPQAAVLASVLNNPSQFDPSVSKANSTRLLERYRYVLDGMLQAGKISQAQHDAAHKKLPVFPDIPLNQRWSGTNGYLMKMVENELVSKGFSADQIAGGGLSITTTFDKTLEDRAIKVGQYYKKTVGENSERGAKNLHPAIASVKVGTGEVLAVYGGDDYLANNRNWATTDRPAASTFKTWATVAALRSGFSLGDTFNGNTFTPQGDSVSIRNEMGMQYGYVTLRKALADSINTAFVDLTHQMNNGPKKIIKAANDAGINSGAGWEPNGRIALGMAEVSPLDNAAGYSTLANQGQMVPRHVVAQVKNAKGKVIYTAPTTGKQAIEKEVANNVTKALAGVVTDGTGTRADIGFPVAGKTGTNGITRNGQNIINSAWFVAYTRQISTAVMFVAGDDGNGSLDSYKNYNDDAFFGGRYPALAWHDFMKVAMEGKEYENFPYASGYGSSTRDSSGYGNSNDNSNNYSNNSNDNSDNGSNGGYVPVPRSTYTRTSQPTATSTAQASSTGGASSAPTATARATATSTSRATATSRPTATNRATSRPTATSRSTATSRPTATSRSTSRSTGTTTGAAVAPTGNGNGAAAQPTAAASR